MATVDRSLRLDKKDYIPTETKKSLKPVFGFM